MAKRRRERDRPKSGPEALYNPNKRVLLSYDSDEEEQTGNDPEQIPVASSMPPVDAVRGSNDIGDNKGRTAHGAGTIPEPISGAEESVPEDAVAGAEDSDAANGGINEEVEDFGGQKPGDTDNQSLFTRGARKNNFTGQWPALGSLSYSWEDGEEEEEYDSEQEEAMAYLRAVR